jgi:radical SAM superfamily enzyme YgiQ (UPF0313 family)
VFGKKVRHYSFDRILYDVELLVRTYNLDELFFFDDLFIHNHKHVGLICKGLEGLRLGINWSAHARVDLVNERILEKMRMQVVQR